MAWFFLLVFDRQTGKNSQISPNGILDWVKSMARTCPSCSACSFWREVTLILLHRWRFIQTCSNHSNALQLSSKNPGSIYRIDQHIVNSISRLAESFNIIQPLFSNSCTDFMIWQLKIDACRLVGAPDGWIRSWAPHLQFSQRQKTPFLVWRRKNLGRGSKMSSIWVTAAF